MRWSLLVLVVLLVFDVWYRGHTFGPDVRDSLGVQPWPAAVGASEPLDCDEAAYAYIGRRIVEGDVMYRDLTENKPPLGYWIYTLAVAAGGYHELTIRVMPIPFVLATIALSWWIALRLGGPVPACLAAGLLAILSTDPYLFGNGANFEHFINLFAVAALALFLRGWDCTNRWCLLGAGICVGAAALVKQVAVLPAVVFVTALAWRARAQNTEWRRRISRGMSDVISFGVGLIIIFAVAAAIVMAGGGGAAAYDDIFHYGRALATDTLPEPGAPSGFIRWVTGNADPTGHLPWPFGSTNYLVWWGTASWPFWLVSIPALAQLLLSPRSTPQRRLVAIWTLAAWAQVTLPGLYWPHYYLLPIVGAAITVAVCWADAATVLAHRVGLASQSAGAGSARAIESSDGIARERNRPTRRSIVPTVVTCLLLTSGICVTLFLEIRDYLLVPPQELTIRYKGGRQWVVLREMGGEIARRSARDGHSRLYIWGWQSPLHFYSHLDSPTRHFFVDNLLRDQADRNHPLIAPRTEEIVATLKRNPPELIFTGYPPFRALRAFLNAHYLRSRMAHGLWVRRDDFGRFETAR
jgi:4-amino-4-deoxy-L-arabinose transferase-like glycosyltransferase